MESALTRMALSVVNVLLDTTWITLESTVLVRGFLHLKSAMFVFTYDLLPPCLIY